MTIATLCYVQEGNKTLMLQHSKKDIRFGKWNGLGGKIEPGETPEECVIREVKEESGLKITNPELKGVLTFPGCLNEEDWLVFVYIAKTFEGTTIESTEGKLGWFTNEEILNLNLWEGDHYFLPWMWEGKFFSAKFNYKGDKLLDHSVVFH